MSNSPSSSEGPPGGTAVADSSASAQPSAREEAATEAPPDGRSDEAAPKNGGPKDASSAEGGRKPRRIRERLSAWGEQRAPRRPKVVVPSFFTLLNLFCGVLALTQVVEGAFVWACWLIVLAGFFDTLDGLTARLTGAQSSFGVQLDSLSDVVSFGVAPACLVWAYGLRVFGPLGMVVAALPALCGAVRLARYNVSFDGEKDDTFEGLPIPAQALALVVLILTFEGADWFSRVSAGRLVEDNLSVLIPVVIVLAGLMVSSVRFGTFPKPTPAYARAHPYKVSLYLVGVLLLPFLQELVLLVFLAGYIAVGVAQSMYGVVQAVRGASDSPAPSEKS